MAPEPHKIKIEKISQEKALEKLCIKSKAYLLVIYILRDSRAHIHRERYLITSQSNTHNTQSQSTRGTITRDIIRKSRARVCGKRRI